VEIVGRYRSEEECVESIEERRNVIIVFLLFSKWAWGICWRRSVIDFFTYAKIQELHRG
jgi:hypothetical protein